MGGGRGMGVAEGMRGAEFATVEVYCDRVASAVGRLSVRVFGLPEDDGILLAHHLGRALQLTNILRDIDEDAALGRLYLPRERLLLAGITDDDPQKVIADRALPKVCATRPNPTTNTGIHLVSPGTHQALPTARWLGTGVGRVGPKGAKFPLAAPSPGRRWQLGPGDSPLPLWVFDEGRRVPDTTLLDYL